MTKEQFIKSISYMGIAYGKAFDEKTCEVWYAFLKNYTYEQLNKAISRLINRSKWMPSIAEVKQEIVLMTNPLLETTSDTAWEELQSAVKRFGFYGAIEGAESLSPLVRKACERIGGFREVCISTTPAGMLRKQFCDAYDELRTASVESLSYSEKTLTQTEKSFKALVDKERSEDYARLNLPSSD